MRIAICGTHGIGKTTLVRSVFNHYVDTIPVGEVEKWPFDEVIDEAARDVAAQMGVDSLANIKYWPADERSYFQWRVMMNQVTEEEAWRSFLSDRSVVDNLAYCIYYGCPENMVSAFKDFCRIHAEKYDMLFYLPIPFQLSKEELNDGFRMSDFQSMVDVDEIISGILESDVVNCPVTILPENRSAWMVEVVDCIDTEVLRK